LIAEYLEHAFAFERMAADELEPEIRAQFKKQSVAYRKLAEGRSEKARFGATTLAHALA
jgi:hypothetical protein